MYVASKSTVRWFLALFAVYLMLGFLVRPYIPERAVCHANDIFLASVFALIGVLCVLVGAAGPWSQRRDKHPISFWSMNVVIECVLRTLRTRYISLGVH